MENRDEIIDEIIDKVIKLLDDKEDFDLSELRLSKKLFLQEEILKYNEKIDMIKYLKKENNKKIFIEKNLEILIFFVKEIKIFLLSLKNKKKDLLENVFNESIDSLENFEKFQKFMYNDKIYLVHYSHYFTKSEIEKYTKIWNDLEEFTLLNLNNEKIISEYWEKNFEKIKIKILELILFINEISR